MKGDVSGTLIIDGGPTGLEDSRQTYCRWFRKHVTLCVGQKESGRSRKAGHDEPLIRAQDFIISSNRQDPIMVAKVYQFVIS